MDPWAIIAKSNHILVWELNRVCASQYLAYMRQERWLRRFQMTKIEGVCRDVCEATEFVTIVTAGDDGPHVVGNWGDYMRILGIKGDMIILPVGQYRQTEQNLRRNNRIQLLVASKKVQGSSSAGQGCLIVGTAEISQFGRHRGCGKGEIPLGAGRDGDPRRGCQNPIIAIGASNSPIVISPQFGVATSAFLAD